MTLILNKKLGQFNILLKKEKSKEIESGAFRKILRGVSMTFSSRDG